MDRSSSPDVSDHNGVWQDGIELYKHSVEEQPEDDDGQWGRSVDPVGAVVNPTQRCHAGVEGSGAATICILKEPQPPVRFRVNNLSQEESVEE